jgi:hypothetical protein
VAGHAQEVLDEVRDGKSLQLLASLPFTLEVQEPTEESIKIGKSKPYVMHMQAGRQAGSHAWPQWWLLLGRLGMRTHCPRQI